MRPLFIALLALGVASPVSSQDRTITAAGKAVLLYPDGTWTLAPLADSNPIGNDRPPKATERVEFAQGKAALYFDPAKWRVTTSHYANRTSLLHVSGDAMTLILVDRLQMSRDALRELVFENLREEAPDARVLSELRKQVNGLEVLELEMTGTISGVSFVYLGYYYAGPEGSFQVVACTGANLIDEYRLDLQGVLNGLVLLQ